MNVTEIFRWITSRTGENHTDVLTKELNLAAIHVWSTTDVPGSLFEMYLRTNELNIMTMPPYIWRVLGIRHANQQHITLNTPRAYYGDNRLQQSTVEWREMGRSALLRSLTGAGRLRARLANPNSEPFTLTISGPDVVSNHTTNTLSFGTTDIQKETTKAFSDVMNISKSAVISSDVEIYDVNDTLVGLLLANQFRADCLVYRVRDASVVPVVTNNTTFTVLYKQRPPVFVDGQEDSVDDQVGMILANYVSAELLARSKDAGDQGRARVYENRAIRGAGTLVTNEGEAKNEPLRIATSGHYHVYSGTL